MESSRKPLAFRVLYRLQGMNPSHVVKDFSLTLCQGQCAFMNKTKDWSQKSDSVLRQLGKEAGTSWTSFLLRIISTMPQSYPKFMWLEIPSAHRIPAGYQNLALLFAARMLFRDLLGIGCDHEAWVPASKTKDMLCYFWTMAFLEELMLVQSLSPFTGWIQVIVMSLGTTDPQTRVLQVIVWRETPSTRETAWILP
jgi:hypothetical protein